MLECEKCVGLRFKGRASSSIAFVNIFATTMKGAEARNHLLRGTSCHGAYNRASVLPDFRGVERT